MLDIKQIREDKVGVIQALSLRGKDFSLQIHRILEIDEERRTLSSQGDEMKAEKNKASKEIAIKKSTGENPEALLGKMKHLSDVIKEIDVKISSLEKEQQNLLLTIPNTPNPSTKLGKDDSDNEEIRKFGTPRIFSFTPKPHWEIGQSLDILDSERAAKVTGSRFHFLKGYGAKLERALINFFLDQHINAGYVEVMPPFIANESSMIGTGQLPKFGEDMFQLQGLDYYLVPTAEVPVTNMYRQEILSKDQLPIRHCAYSACFRAEAGSAGRDTRGLIRQHQFNKVELVQFVAPEQSDQALETLTNDAENLLKLLEIPYRVVALCGGDLGFSSQKTYDIEVWLPSYNRYAEISSCSNFKEFQSRRANIKFKENPKDKAQFVHTLNGSGLAVGRTMAAILENYQNQDGTVTIPKVLVPYMGCDVIK